jgi:hypothetical protein
MLTLALQSVYAKSLLTLSAETTPAEATVDDGARLAMLAFAVVALLLALTMIRRALRPFRELIQTLFAATIVAALVLTALAFVVASVIADA